MKRKKTPWLIIAQIITLIGAVVLSYESYLSMGGQSICTTSSCEIVGGYIRIGSQILVVAGALFFWLLALVLFFASRYPAGRFAILPALLLFPALAFDGALIGFQFLTIREACQLCIGVAVLLLAVTILYSISRKSWLIVLTGLLAWSGSFAAGGIIDIPAPSGAYSSMVLIKQHGEADALKNQTTVTLILSMNCPHCINVVAWIADNKLPPVNWKIAFIDKDKRSIQRIEAYIQLARETGNIFAALEESKNETEPTGNDFVLDPSVVKEKSQKTLAFMSNVGATSVPFMIIKHSPSRSEHISGAGNIIEALKTLRQ